MATVVTIGDLVDTAFFEKYVIKVKSDGSKKRRKKAPKGFKYVKGRLTRISSLERIARSKGAKIGSRKRRGQRAEIKRKSNRAKKYRKSYGL